MGTAGESTDEFQTSIDSLSLPIKYAFANINVLLVPKC